MNQNEVDLHVAKSLAANEHRLHMATAAAGRFFVGGKDRVNGGYFPDDMFRFTTEDERIADEMSDFFRVDKVTSMAYERGSNVVHEIRTNVNRLGIFISNQDSVISNLVRRKNDRVRYISDETNIIWSRNASFFNSSSIVVDPQAGLSLGDRKKLFQVEGIGAAPETDLYFRFQGGSKHLFRFSSRSWEFYRDINGRKFQERLKDGNIHASLRAIKTAAHNRVVLSVNS